VKNNEKSPLMDLQRRQEASICFEGTGKFYSIELLLLPADKTLKFGNENSLYFCFSSFGKM
jgi:hypothetical protein